MAVLTAGWVVIVLGTPSAAITGVQASGQPAASTPAPPPAPAASQATSRPDHQTTVRRYCVSCHNQRMKTAGLMLDTLDAEHPAASPAEWEKVITKLRAGSMPPTGVPRPDAATYAEMIGWLEGELDRAWVASPNPGRIGAVHRLNRTQYNNAMRDLFALPNIDVRSQLPGDETADGSFDNFADSLSISTAHLERYLSVARQITRLATGLPPSAPALSIYEVPLHIVQDDLQSEDLPLGSRGGIAVRYNAPVDGEYTVKVRLRRQYQDYLMGMGWAQQLDVRVDGKLAKRFTVGGAARGRPAASSYAGDGEPNFAGDPEWEEYMQLTGDAGLDVRVPMKAGPRVIGVSFVREQWEPEGLPQPLQRGRVLTNDNLYMDNAAVGAVHVSGPYNAAGPAADTPSKRAVFVCQPKSTSEEPACATRILSRISRLAYRRPVTKADVEALMTFFNDGRREGGSFEAGIQFALERMLVDPDFLLRVHRDSAEHEGGAERRCPEWRCPERRRPVVSDGRPRLRRAVVLPVEQHPRRAPAGTCRAWAADQTGRARTGSAPHAGGPTSQRHRPRLRGQWLCLRRVQRCGCTIATCIPTSTTTSGALQDGNGDVRRLASVREDRSVLDLIRPTTRSSTSGSHATTAPRHLRRPLPAHHLDVKQRGGILGARKHPADHHVSRSARRRCCAASGCSKTSSGLRFVAAARVSPKLPEPNRHEAADHPRAARPAPQATGMRQLSRDHRSRRGSPSNSSMRSRVPARSTIGPAGGDSPETPLMHAVHGRPAGGAAAQPKESRSTVARSSPRPRWDGV